MATTARKSINIDGASHGAMPIPMASLKGGFLATGAVYGWEKGDPQKPIDAQCESLFAKLEQIMASAGGSMDDIIKFSVQLASGEYRGDLNTVWTQYFPDEGSRPARHVKIAPIANENRLVSVEILAVINT